MTCLSPTWTSEDGSVILYNADCLTVLPTLEAGSVATGRIVTLTDPPYGLDFRGEAWDSAIPDWLPLARSLCAVVAFPTAPTTAWDYPRPDWVCCWYREAAQSRTVFGGFNHWTPVLVYGNPGKELKVDSIKLNANVHKSPKDIGHPSPKPLAFAEWMVTRMSLATDTVLDPFTGSGTTGVACVKTGRRFIGIEIDAGYFEIARKRIEAAIREKSEQLIP